MRAKLQFFFNWNFTAYLVRGSDEQWSPNFFHEGTNLPSPLSLSPRIYKESSLLTRVPVAY
jgi:hypothetical protein